MTEAQDTIARRLRWQAGWCRRLGSPLYTAILERTAEDVEAGGPAWRLLQGREREPPGAFLPLRLAGAVHRLVLMGRLPALAALYPSAGGKADTEAAPTRFLEALDARAADVLEHIDRPVQTNEVARCAGLVGGFLTIAAETGRPLCLLEVGASAGLILRFDRYRYSSGETGFGDPASPVRFENVFENGVPPFDAPLTVSERHASDANPLDPRAEEDRLTLMSYVWPDQTERFVRLRGALEIAAQDDVTLERASAAAWAKRMLAEPRPGVATVLFHSVMVQYLTPAEGKALHETINAAGRRATRDAPFAWLFLEPGEQETDVRLTLWPGGEQRLLAHAGFQSTRVDWLG